MLLNKRFFSTLTFIAVVSLIPARSQQAANPTVTAVDTNLVMASSTVGQNVTNEQITRIPISRSVSDILKIVPAVKDTVTVSGATSAHQPSGVAVTGNSSGLNFILRMDTKQYPPSTQLYSCNEIDDFFCTRVQAINTSYTPGVMYGGDALAGVISLVTRSGSSSESSFGFVFDPAHDRRGPGFPLFVAPEKIFPRFTICSTGLSRDLDVSFQVLNFSQAGGQVDSFVIFRKLNNNGRPFGPMVKWDYPANYFVTSGTISNRIDSSTGPDYRFFSFRQFRDLNLPSMASQVNLVKLNADTLAPMGSVISYSPWLKTRYSYEEQSQSVAIEPNGIYLSYTNYNASCMKNLPMLRRINLNTGAPSSAPRALRTCGDAADLTYGYTALNIFSQVQGN